MDQKKIELRKVRDFGQLLSATFEFIRQNFKLLFKSNLLIAAPFILLAGVFMGLYQSSLFNFSNEPEIEQFAIPFLISMAFMMLSYLVITMVTYSFIVLYKSSDLESFDIDDVWQKTKSNFWMLLFTGIGYAVILFFGLYISQNLRRPILVSYVSEKIPEKILATGLSVESQLKTLIIVILSPFVGFIIDTFSLGLGIIICGLIILLLYPINKLKY